MSDARKIPGFIAALLLVAMIGTAQADDDVQRGAILADTCLGCHGIAGYRNGYPSYRVPKLGGQHNDYLLIGLQSYKNESRAHPTMRAQAASLTEQDMRDLAAFFTGQGEPETGKSASGVAISRGQEKASACQACHGERGISPASNWPSLAGQHQDYLRQALQQYQDGSRSDPVMVGQAISLTDEDIEDIAAFYAAQPGLFTASYND
jgi:cytochrome c553